MTESSGKDLVFQAGKIMHGRQEPQFEEPEVVEPEIVDDVEPQGNPMFQNNFYGGGPTNIVQVEGTINISNLSLSPWWGTRTPPSITLGGVRLSDG
jgi:hypothetical protein